MASPDSNLEKSMLTRVMLVLDGHDADKFISSLIMSKGLEPQIAKIRADFMASFLSLHRIKFNHQIQMGYHFRRRTNCNACSYLVCAV